jgi:integrase
MLEQLFLRLKAATGTLSPLMGTRRVNHTGTVMQRSDGRWRGRIQLGVTEDGTPDIRTVYGRTEAEAWKKLDDIRLNHQAGTLAAISADRLSLEVYLYEHWLPAVKPTLKPTTYLSYSQITKNQLVPLLGSYKLGRLSSRTIQTALGKLTDNGLSPQTVKTVLQVLHRALAYAVRWGYLRHNPASTVDTPPIPKIRRRILSPEQIKRLLAVKTDRLELLWRMALVTGARQGELLGLQWRDFDANDRWVEIVRSYNPKVGYQVPKNGKSRKIPLPTSITTALEIRRMKGKYTAPDAPIFASSNGTPLLGPNVTRMFQRRLTAAGIAEHFRFHDLRHTHATLMLRRHDVSTAAVSDVLGHYSPAVTHGLYNQGSVDSGGDYRAAQEGLIGG